jgi:hypothetical protein
MGEHLPAKGRCRNSPTIDRRGAISKIASAVQNRRVIAEST